MRQCHVDPGRSRSFPCSSIFHVFVVSFFADHFRPPAVQPTYTREQNEIYPQTLSFHYPLPAYPGRSNDSVRCIYEWAPANQEYSAQIEVSSFLLASAPRSLH